MNTTTITSNNETFSQITYNGISILVRDSDSYVNVSKMIIDLTGKKKRVDKLLSNGSWKEYFEEFQTIYSGRPNGHPDYIYKLNIKYNNKTQGWYFDPRLVNYVAIWASPKYAVTVGKIMDSIDKKVHEVLKKKELNDTVENAEPIYNEVVEEITTMNLLDKAWKKCNDSNDFSDYDKMKYIISDKMY